MASLAWTMPAPSFQAKVKTWPYRIPEPRMPTILSLTSGKNCISYPDLTQSTAALQQESDVLP